MSLKRKQVLLECGHWNDEKHVSLSARHSDSQGRLSYRWRDDYGCWLGGGCPWKHLDPDPIGEFAGYYVDRMKAQTAGGKPEP